MMKTWDEFRQQLPKGFKQPELDLVARAWELGERKHATQKRASGEPYFMHPIAVAEMLCALRLDGETIAAALLHDIVEDQQVPLLYLQEQFGKEVAGMVGGVTKLQAITDLVNMPADSRDPKAESLRKMFLGMVNDIRIVFIKLADRLHNMQTLQHMSPDKQRRISRETLEIYAPLAGTLGMYHTKWELEDLAFKYFNPEAYADIQEKLAATQEEREAFIALAVETLQAELKKADITGGEVSGRPKHVFSIWRKMKRKGVLLDEVYDREGVRVIVPTIGDCYAALGIVHSVWRPFSKEFDDYIANPKDNQYQSLHTAVVGPKGQPLEVQIRTPEMHRISEIGIAAHWRYKAPGRMDEAYETKVSWLRSVIDWSAQERSNSAEFMATVVDELFRDRVYAFTPKGDVVDLPVGATPIDFAYAVHTEIGHRCRGARVNDIQVALDYKLQNSDRVEIKTAKQGGPSRDWMNPNLSFTITSKAQARIRQYFRQQERDVNIAAGRELLESELKRLGVDDKTYEQIAHLFGHDKVDDFLAAIGCGDVTTVEIATKVLQIGKVEPPAKTIAETLQAQELSRDEAPQRPALAGDGVYVAGLGNTLTVLSRCCNPMSPDPIVGFVTRGRGVTVHRAECPNVINFEDERLISVQWGSSQQLSRVKIRVKAYDRAGLLNDITNILFEERINLEDASASTGGQNGQALITATLLVRGADQLSRVLAHIARLRNVQEVLRQKG